MRAVLKRCGSRLIQSSSTPLVGVVITELLFRSSVLFNPTLWVLQQYSLMGAQPPTCRRVWIKGTSKNRSTIFETH